MSGELFARGRGTPWRNATPFLGGLVLLLPIAVAAGTPTMLPHTLRVAPRTAIVLAAGAAFCARTRIVAATAADVSVEFDVAQPAGTVLWIW